MTASFSDQFRFSITKALGGQLVDAMEELTPASLTQENLDALDIRAEIDNIIDRCGVYQLYRNADLVRVGRAEKSLSFSLGNHLREISRRGRIPLGEMTFKALYIAEDLSAVAPEKLLIKHYRQRGCSPWNVNGLDGQDFGCRV